MRAKPHQRVRHPLPPCVPPHASQADGGSVRACVRCTMEAKPSPEPLATHKVPRQKHKFLNCHTAGGGPVVATVGLAGPRWCHSPTHANVGATTCVRNTHSPCARRPVCTQVDPAHVWEPMGTQAHRYAPHGAGAPGPGPARQRLSDHCRGDGPWAWGQGAAGSPGARPLLPAPCL